MLISYFRIFQRGFEVLNVIPQASVHVTISPPLCITMSTTVGIFFNISLAVQLLIKIFYHLVE